MQAMSQAHSGEAMAQRIARALEQAEAEPEASRDTLADCLLQCSANPQAIAQIVGLALSQQRHAVLTDSMETVLRERPELAPLRGQLTGVYLGQQQNDRALVHLAHLSDHEARGDVKVHRLLVDTLHSARRLEEEVARAREAQVLFPSEPAFYVAEGLALAGLADHEGALQAHRNGVKACPEAANLWTSLGVMQFMLTDCREGFEAYAHRFDQHNATRIPWEVPLWQGEKLAGKSILVQEEQGIGDVLMWLGLIPPLLAQAGQVTLAHCAKLQPLLARSFPQAQLIDAEMDTVLRAQHAHDYVVHLADLMRYVLPNYRPGEHAPVIQADAALSDELRTRYRQIASARGASQLVGIAWHTTNQRTGAYRNIPLDQWAPILSQPHCQFICLQYGDHAEELAQIEAAFPGAIYRDPAVDAFAQTDALAAQVAAMDCVITTQNATAHLGGALGVPTTLALSAASSWRFGLHHTDTNLWYRSLRIERQERIYHWQPVIERIAAQLRKESQ